MNISGTGITPFDAKIKQNFKPNTSLALDWKKLSSGNWYAIDRTTTEDVYESAISLYGEEASITTFIAEIEANRVAGSNVVTMTPDGDAEGAIFGANLAEATFSVTVEMNFRRQGSLKGFGVPLKCRNLSPSFSGTPTLPELYTEVGYSADSSYSIYKKDSYEGAFSYIDRERDEGFFEGTFKLKLADMKNAREYIRQIRDSTFSLSDSVLIGVDNLFGRRSSAYPYSVKILEWEDLGPNASAEWWKLKIKFVEVI